jgi:hypothetical protein
MGILVVIAVIAVIIWAFSNSSYDGDVHTHIEYTYDPTATIDDIGDMAKWPVKAPDVPVAVTVEEPQRRVWNTAGVLTTVPDVPYTSRCIAQYDAESGKLLTREEAMMWYIDPLIAGNPISPAEQKVIDALNEFPVEWYREVSFYGMPLPSGKHGRVDFFIPALCLVIEYDGQGYHETPEQLARDKMKDEFCARWGYTMIRLNNKNYYCMDYTISGIMAKYGIRRK